MKFPSLYHIMNYPNSLLHEIRTVSPEGLPLLVCIFDKARDRRISLVVFRPSGLDLANNLTIILDILLLQASNSILLLLLMTFIKIFQFSCQVADQLDEEAATAMKREGNDTPDDDSQVDVINSEEEEKDLILC
jgi:hypothetical protein